MKNHLSLRVLVTTLLFVLLFSAVVFAQEKSELKWSDKIIRGKLDNGLTYIIKKHQKPEKRVFAWLLVNAGSVNETEKEQGIAHFIEHMAFNGTKNFAPGELVKYFASIGVDWGADLNAYTSFDKTVFIIEAPTDKDEYVDKCFTALCDYSSFMLLKPEEIEKEKGVIIQELRLGSTLNKRIFEKQSAIMYKGSLYPQRLPIGKEETINAFNSELVNGFYKKWYRPDNMVLVVMGDYEPSKLEEKVKSIFSLMPSGDGEKPDNLVPFKPHKEIYTDVITDPELKDTTAEIDFLREPSSTRTIDDYRKDLCDTIIFEMLNNRFDQETYKTGTPLINAYGYKSGWLRAATNVGFHCSILPGKSKEALELFMNYIIGMKTHGFNKVERQEAEKNLIESLKKAKDEEDTIETLNYMDSIVDSAATNSVFLLPSQDYELVCKLLPSITDEEIKERVNYLLSSENMCVILETPEKDGANVNNSDVKQIVDNVLKTGGTKYELEKLEYSYDYSSLKEAKIVSRKEYKDINLTEIELDNGLKVLLKPTDFDKDTVYAGYVSLGGKLLESSFNPGMYDVARMAWGNGGTEDLTPSQIERLLSGKNIRFDTSGLVSYGIRGTCTKKEQEELFQWMWQYLVRPGYRKEGVEYGIKVIQENLRKLEQYQEGIVVETENKILLPNNPLSVKPKEEDIAKYTSPEDLKKFQNLSCTPSNSELLIVGSFDLEDTVKLVCKYFGSLPKGDKPHIPDNYRNAVFPEGYTKRIVYRGMEKRGKGQILFPGCMKWDDDVLALDVLSTILDVRLNKNIREDKSLVYSIGSRSISPANIKGYGRFKIAFGTEPEKMDQVIEGVITEIKNMKENGPTEEELASAKKVMFADYDESFKRNDFWFSEIEGCTLYNFAPDLSIKNKEELSKITLKDIQNVANKYLDERRIFTLIALPSEVK